MATKRDSSEYKIDDPAEMMVPPAAPAHPGPMLATLLKAKGITVVRAAESMGVNRPNLHNVLTGRAALTWDMAFKLADLIGIGSADVYMREQARWERAEAYARHGRAAPAEAA